MNDDPHRKVWWHGKAGEAWFEGQVFPLLHAPRLVGIKRIAYLQYSPRAGIRDVREYGKGDRKLTDEECADIESRFPRMQNGAQDAWS